MKHIFLVFSIIFFLSDSASAQIEKPVTWSYKAIKKNQTEAIIYIKATIDSRWHIYSQSTKDGGPVKTTFTFSPSKDYNLVGKTIEPKPIIKYEETFKMNVGYFEKLVVFQQKIRLNKAKATIRTKVEFMSCNDKQCLPPEEIEFNIPVG